MKRKSKSKSQLRLPLMVVATIDRTKHPTETKDPALVEALADLLLAAARARDGSERRASDEHEDHG